MRRRAALLAAALLAAGALAPAAAQAHGISGSADLPIPQWLFAWAAAIVLIASFVALGVLWPAPRLQRPRLRRVLTIPPGVRTLCGLVGVALYGVVLYAAFAGTTVPTANLAPTAIYVAFWVGVPVLSVLLGDVFALFSPWRALYRWIAGAARRVHTSLDAEPLAYPAWLGRWPAAVGLVAFAWVELVYVDKDVPATLGALALAYGFVQVVGMSVYGERTWSERADAFGVWFNLCSRLSIWETRGRELCVRAPLSGLPRLDPLPGTVAVLVALIGSTTFDGASNGVLWVDVAPWLQDRFGDLGASLTVASELAASVGLAVALAAVAGLYQLGIRGMRTLDPRRDAGELARAFAHTLAPIALAYALAHYFSLLVFQGQALIYLASDPLGTGANLLGTANTQVDYTLISPTGIWYVQVAALVAGHVAGLVLAHDRALAVFAEDRRAAVRSQYWMLTVMVGFTCLGLWLLSAVNA
ncbi:MAG: fenitrothion hydrolase [Actinobacteria bacterium]|nr:fenitrothion hydrolase [Actinomycetota bacterium]